MSISPHEQDQFVFWRERRSNGRWTSAKGQELRVLRGPPTANGRPGTHHVLARAFKDMFPRFHTMNGATCCAKAADTDGLPVEIEVEKSLASRTSGRSRNTASRSTEKCRERLPLHPGVGASDRAHRVLGGPRQRTLPQRLHQASGDPGSSGTRPLYQGYKVVLPRPLWHAAEQPRGLGLRRSPSSVFVRCREGPARHLLPGLTHALTLPGNAALAEWAAAWIT